MAIKQMINAFNLTPGTVVRSERHVLLELANLADGNKGDSENTLYYGIDTLAAITGYAPDTVSRAINSLVEKGLIVRQRRFNTSNFYTVCVPKTKREKIIKKKKITRANF